MKPFRRPLPQNCKSSVPTNRYQQAILVRQELLRRRRIRQVMLRKQRVHIFRLCCIRFIRLLIAGHRRIMNLNHTNRIYRLQCIQTTCEQHLNSLRDKYSQLNDTQFKQLVGQVLAIVYHIKTTFDVDKQKRVSSIYYVALNFLVEDNDGTASEQHYAYLRDMLDSIRIYMKLADSDYDPDEDDPYLVEVDQIVDTFISTLTILDNLPPAVANAD